jgi:hypothetical protein
LEACLMPFYDFICEDCAIVRTVKRTFETAGDELICSRCEEPMERVFTAPVIRDNVRIPATETWDRWYSGQETAPGLTREQTMAAARSYYKDQKHYTGLNPKKTISTATHPAAAPYSGDV